MNTSSEHSGQSTGLAVTPGSPLEVWSFGCIGEPGHYLRRPDGRHEWDAKAQPWGWTIDGGLCEGNKCGPIDGKTWEHHKDGWTAVAMWDRSGDSRGASCTVFLVHAEATTPQIIEAARIQWPQLFSRRGFPLANVEISHARERADNPSK